MTILLTFQERKALIDQLVAHDMLEFFKLAIGEGVGDTGRIRKNIRKLYNKCDDAKLLSIKVKGE
jgi:isochorismate hydrolase